MLTEDETRRYSRQIALPEIGVEGQRRLAAGRVLMAGLGGLGSIAAIHMLQINRNPHCPVCGVQTG